VCAEIINLELIDMVLPVYGLKYVKKYTIIWLYFLNC